LEYGRKRALDLSFWSGADHRSRPDIPGTQVNFYGCPLRFGHLARPSLGQTGSKADASAEENADYTQNWVGKVEKTVKG
jgi:hypothetical protein